MVAVPGARARFGPLFLRRTGQGPLLLLLHGLSSSSRYWEPHFPTLGRAYRVLAPDLLGFGRSPKPASATYTPEEHIAVLLTTIEPFLEGPLTLVGHSMGAALALHLAVARPRLVEQLVLVSLPVIGSTAWGHRADGRAGRFHHFGAHTAAGRALYDGSFRAVRPFAERIYPRLRPAIPPGAARDALLMSWAAYWGTLENVIYGSDIPGLFAAAGTPLLLLHGARDRQAPFASARALARTRPEAQFIEIPNAGHDLAYSHAQQCCATILGLQAK
ncbi:MAG: alpha/beta fold hydrolase [Dehalococcoidia bacterium]